MVNPFTADKMALLVEIECRLGTGRDQSRVAAHGVAAIASCRGEASIIISLRNVSIDLVNRSLMHRVSATSTETVFQVSNVLLTFEHDAQRSELNKNPV